MTLRFDYFKFEYDDSIPAFVEVDDKHFLHRPTSRFLDRVNLTARWTADGYTPHPKEVGKADEWLWKHFTIGAPGGGGGGGGGNEPTPDTIPHVLIDRLLSATHYVGTWVETDPRPALVFSAPEIGPHFTYEVLAEDGSVTSTGLLVTSDNDWWGVDRGLYGFFMDPGKTYRLRVTHTPTGKSGTFIARLPDGLQPGSAIPSNPQPPFDTDLRDPASLPAAVWSVRFLSYENPAGVPSMRIRNEDTVWVADFSDTDGKVTVVQIGQEVVVPLGSGANGQNALVGVRASGMGDDVRFMGGLIKWPAGMAVGEVRPAARVAAPAAPIDDYPWDDMTTHAQIQSWCDDNGVDTNVVGWSSMTLADKRAWLVRHFNGERPWDSAQGATK